MSNSLNKDEWLTLIVASITIILAATFVALTLTHTGTTHC